VEAFPEFAPTGDRLPATLSDRIENAASFVLLIGMALLPILEIVGRRAWRTGIPGSSALVQHATLWIGLLGGAIAARDGRLLSLGRLSDRFREPFRGILGGFSAAVSAAISLLLAWSGSFLFLLIQDDFVDNFVP
jgi:TRAP-type C4-dicarboxylate transport system permease small subunit